MKRFFVLLAIFGSCSASGFYTSLSPGMNWVNSKDEGIHFRLKPGYLIATAAGYELPRCRRWWSRYRFECEYAFRHNRIQESYHFDHRIPCRGSIYSHSMMLNVTCPFSVDFHHLCFFYGAGIGATRQKEHIITSDHFEIHDEWRGFATQLYAGATVSFSTCGTIDLEYRFFDGMWRMQNHSVSLKLTYEL